MHIKSVKMNISKYKKMCSFLISQGSLNPKIPSSKTVISSLRTEKQTDGQTNRQTRKWKQRTPFQGFRFFFKFSFNLSSRSGPIISENEYCNMQALFCLLKFLTSLNIKTHWAEWSLYLFVQLYSHIFTKNFTQNQKIIFKHNS